MTQNKIDELTNLVTTIESDDFRMRLCFSQMRLHKCTDFITISEFVRCLWDQPSINLLWDDIRDVEVFKWLADRLAVVSAGDSAMAAYLYLLDLHNANAARTTVVQCLKIATPSLLKNVTKQYPLTQAMCYRIMYKQF